jgi:gamma-glutamyltranspeptidase/glutathione hydrolase
MKRLFFLITIGISCIALSGQPTQKPLLHGRHWMAITGKPLAATAGAAMFHQGGNAVDAACAMLAATCTMWDVLSWGGETQVLLYHPKLKKVIAINALGIAPTGATPEFFKSKNMAYPPEYGPLSAVTPGTPGGLLYMLAEYGTLSLAQVLQPALQLADGYPIEAQTADLMERHKDKIKAWPYSQSVMLPHLGASREAPHPGEIFRQADLLQTLQKMVDAEKEALRAGKSRKAAITAAYERFYAGDIAQEFVRGCQEQGGLITMKDLAHWKVLTEEPQSINYKGIEVYKLDAWTQGPAMLQALNMLENYDLKSMGYNSTAYIHLLYQVMNLAFADRDFYYGDPYSPPTEPIRGLLSKEYARARIQGINPLRNNAHAGPGDPYPFQGEQNPYLEWIQNWNTVADSTSSGFLDKDFKESFLAGTTTVLAADKEGWIVSATPSGGWIPAVIAGRTGIGMSQRLQSFVMEAKENPFNVLEPGKRPRVTLTPSLALKDGKPLLAFAVQGGDTQDQNLLQFFLNMIEFGMNVQEACEAPNINSYQMRNSFGKHDTKPGALTLSEEIPDWTRRDLQKMGYKLSFERRSSGPINAIFFDWKNGAFQGGSSNHGEDYGIGW